MAILAACLLSATPTSAQEYGPLSQPGPPLSAPRADLRASLECTADVRNADTTPVLLLSGTTVDPDENFAWNWMPALTEAGFPWCAATSPEPDNMDDIQERGEWIVYAIRRMYRLADRRIAIYGHSQGGMVGRWALRFWPDTRRMVTDVVGAAPSNHGTETAALICAPGCAPSLWQQSSDSRFVDALNSRAETFRGVSYTNVFTHLDVIVFPNSDDTGNSSLHTGAGRITNVAVQDICPADLADHLILGTADPVAWALFRDAVTHPGSADPSRIDADVCADSYMPGIDPATNPLDAGTAFSGLANTLLTFPAVPAEPPLRPYVFAR